MDHDWLLFRAEAIDIISQFTPIQSSCLDDLPILFQAVNTTSLHAGPGISSPDVSSFFSRSSHSSHSFHSSQTVHLYNTHSHSHSHFRSHSRSHCLCRCSCSHSALLLQSSARTDSPYPAVANTLDYPRSTNPPLQKAPKATVGPEQPLPGKRDRDSTSLVALAGGCIAAIGTAG